MLKTPRANPVDVDSMIVPKEEVAPHSNLSIVVEAMPSNMRSALRITDVCEMEEADRIETDGKGERVVKIASVEVPAPTVFVEEAWK